MSHKPKNRWTVVFRAMLLIVVFVIFAVGSFSLARAWRGSVSSQTSALETVTRAGTDTLSEYTIDSGRHLVAYVLVSSECGWSTEQLTVKAISELSDSLHASHSEDFVDVSVIGVSLDRDLSTGIRFLQELEEAGAVFDEISIGELWLNEQVIRLVWREGMAPASIPQVLLVDRRVDASAYPRHIDVQRDSVLLNVRGRSDLVTWVNSGTPLDSQRPSISTVTP